ncbi:MAG TPA: hypothetical protein VFP98_04205 [Candidatus Polarisedimenticolia bacterium]|nr:hypothetical protein [Candidatus Polarisedimenticolia bacterium]
MTLAPRGFPLRPILWIGLAAASLLLSACSGTSAHCDVCGRDECTGLAFTVEYADGTVQRTCCPKCASHAVAEAEGREVASLRARDFSTGRQVDARLATYVEGSQVEHCRAPVEVRAEQGCCRMLTYDRCLPSLIAFGAIADAETFAREHGGRVVAFDDLGFGRE